MADCDGDGDGDDDSAPTAKIFISVPHDLHAPLAIRALGAGRDVVMEKPLAPTVDECREILSYSSSLSCPGRLIISEQSPYWEEIALARKMCEEGRLGTLIGAASYYYESMRDNTTSGTDESGGLGWRASVARAGGGIVVDGGLHWIRPLRELCGDVDSVVGVCRRNVQPGLRMEGETMAHALLKMRADPSGGEGDGYGDGSGGGESYRVQPPDSGPLVATFSANLMHTSPMAHDMCPYFRFTGTKGELVVHGDGLNPKGGGGLRLYDQENPDGIDLIPRDRQGGFFLGFRGVWSVIAPMLRSNDRDGPRRTVLEAAKDVAVAMALYQSSAKGSWEQCETF